MANYSAQNSITIKRLRNNDSVTISLESNGIALFQAIDSVSGTVSPDWTNTNNQPTVTPTVYSAQGASVSLSSHSWTYNTAALVFSGTTSGGWTTDSTEKFQMYTDGTLKVIANLASASNTANDTLIYTGVLTTNGIESSISKEATITIVQGGANSYNFVLTATTNVLSTDTTSTTISSTLYLGTGTTTPTSVKWYKDDSRIESQSGSSLTVTRDMVDGYTYFFAEAIVDGETVARAGLLIQDISDTYVAMPYITGSTGDTITETVDEITIAAYILNQTTGESYSPTGTITYEWDVFAGNDPDPIDTSTASTIAITKEHTDYVEDGVDMYRDVLVSVQLDFN